MLSKKQTKSKNILSEPAATYEVNAGKQFQVRSVFRDIGNSKGVIISKKMMDIAGIQNNNVVIEASRGEIRIRPIDEKLVNTDLSSWGKQFKDALKAGQLPDEDLFDGMKNKFDEEEW
jgi:antitoxin component of MazEF toxin-antitoxin module